MKKLIFLLAFVFLFLVPINRVNAQTIYGQCRELNLSSCNPNIYDLNHCYDIVPQYYEETGRDSVGDPNSGNWTESNCRSTAHGCFVPIPNETNSRGETIGVCVALKDEAPTEVVNCDTIASTSYRDQCSISDYELCFDTNNHPLPNQVSDADCIVNPPGVDTVWFFENQKSLDVNMAQANTECGFGENTICGEPLPVSCTVNGNNRCCPTEQACDDIGGTTNYCQKISRVSANLNDCENNTNKPVLCKDTNWAGNEQYYCCQSESACKDIGGKETDPIVEKEEYKEFKLCNQVSGEQKSVCQTCFDNDGVWTAIGCVPTDPVEMIGVFINVGISIGGGVAMLSMIVAGFLYTSSKGDPQKTGQAKELMTSAVIGLLFVIFSITILQFIAGDLIRLPGFANETNVTQSTNRGTLP